MATRAESKARTRERLLAAADAAFVRDGFHGARLQDIAAAAGVTTGALYAGFEGKDDLFVAVYARRLDERLAEIGALGEREADRDAVAEQWFERLDRERNWHIAAMEFRLHAARDPELSRRFREQQRRFVRGTARAFAHGRAELGAAEQEALARASLALGNGYALERFTDPDSVSAAELAAASESMLRGLGRALRGLR